ncbi:MAG: hypothetical protein ACOH2E_05725, partial [Candidatus Paracaedibacter sp.]
KVEMKINIKEGAEDDGFLKGTKVFYKYTFKINHLTYFLARGKCIIPVKNFYKAVSHLPL